MPISPPSPVSDDDASIGEWGRAIELATNAPARRVVVLLHGLSASPTQFRRFAEALHARGDAVLVPRLPHHGHADRMTDALARLRAHELETFASDVIARAHQLGDRVAVAGFSLGGLLACRIAQREEVDRVVAVAPFLGLAFWPVGLDRLALRTSLRFSNRFLWWNPVMREQLQPAHGYPRYSTHAVAHATRLADAVLRDARHAKPRANSIALVANASEVTVSNAAIARLERRWRAHGAAVERHRLRGLPPSHDIIEPSRVGRHVERIYARLLELIDG